MSVCLLTALWALSLKVDTAQRGLTLALVKSKTGFAENGSQLELVVSTMVSTIQCTTHGLFFPSIHV